MSDVGCNMLGAGAWGWPREMLWGGRWEGGSCLGTHVRIKDFTILKIKKFKNLKNKLKKKKRICLQCRRPRFDPRVGKIPWRRKWQPTPVSLPGKSHGHRNLVDCSPWGRKESGTTEWLTQHTTILKNIFFFYLVSQAPSSFFSVSGLTWHFHFFQGFSLSHHCQLFPLSFWVPFLPSLQGPFQAWFLSLEDPV